MKVAIVGSRRRRDKSTITSFVNGLPADATVVSGGCEDSADVWAVEAARARGLQVLELLPDLTGCTQRFEYTKRYYARNQCVADACDRLVAFVAADRKGGTEDTIRRAIAAGKSVDIR
jgi:hypothetical protein